MIHRHRNQDHSKVTPRLAAEHIVAGVGGKVWIWSVNIEGWYHEEKLAVA
jgi:hypothetical protein